MNLEKLELITSLLLRGRTRKEILLGANIPAEEFDTAIKEGLKLYGLQLQEDEPEFNLETHMFSDKGFQNNVDFICAPIDTDAEFTEEEILSLSKQDIETNWDLIRLNHPFQERIKGHFTTTVIFPIITTGTQEATIDKKIKKQ